MNTTTQWHILWNTSLLPPLEIIPSDSFFSETSQTYTASAVQLFGFSPPLIWEEAQEQPKVCNEDVDDRPAPDSDFSAQGEFAAFLYYME